jgi:hypothetical protein
VKNGVFGDLFAKTCAKPPVFFADSYILGGLEGLFDFYTFSTTIPGPGTPPANSRCTKQFWSRPHGLYLFLCVGPELPTKAEA